MNIYILTAGQCGSRVVTQAMKNLGFDAPDANEKNLDNRPIGKKATPDFRNFELPHEHQDFVLEYVGPQDEAVFKSGPLLRYWRHLDGLLVGAYRHPSLWKQATVARGKKRSFKWWDDVHAEMLTAHLITGMPLVDFSDGFVHDMTRHFGDCLQHFDEAKIHQEEIKEIPPDSSMRIYRGLSECRKSMASITLTRSMLPTLNVGTN